jgi:magnesium-transporting ATPase (P-type)
MKLKETGWAIYTYVSGLAFICMFIITSMGFGQAVGSVDYGGLFQRITLTVLWIWMTLISIHVLRSLKLDR